MTSETETGAETPTVGRISTVPFIRGYRHMSLAEIQQEDYQSHLPVINIRTLLTNVADIPGYPTRNALFGGPQTRTKAVIAAQTIA